MSNEQVIDLLDWTTQDIPQRQRLSCYVDLLCKELIGITTSSCETDDFHAEVRVARVGGLVVSSIGGSSQHSVRTRTDIARTSVQALHLVVGVGCDWRWSDSQTSIELRSGDLILTDSRLEQTFHWGSNCLSRTFRIGIGELDTWLPDVGALIGRRIEGNSPWGRVLSQLVLQISPESLPNLPLSSRIIADQVYALLALAATHVSGVRQYLAPPSQALRVRIADCIAQRCVELQLSSEDVASSVGISTRTLHRVLRAHGETFGALLIDSRLKHATSMLTSRFFHRVTIAELGRRAGFADASHFARAYRKRFGMTPHELRRSRASSQ
jgi:AraC family transcriptional activator of tynA and feaB